MGFPDSSVGKESACNAGDPGSIPGLGRSTGEGIGYPLQYSWASLVAQLVKNLPTMRETWVRYLGWEDPLEKGKVTHSQYSGLENSTDCIVHGVARLSDFHFYWTLGGFPGGASGKEPACQCRRCKRMGSILGQEDPLEEGMATHSSILAWEIPWTEEPGGLQSIGSQRIRHN